MIWMWTSVVVVCVFGAVAPNHPMAPSRNEMIAITVLVSLMAIVKEVLA